MKQKLIYILILPIFAFTMHKYHLSLTKIKFNKEEHTIQITMRCFIDDIEKVINEKNNIALELESKLEHKQADSLIEKYILEEFKIQINKQKQNLNYLGKEYEKDIVYFYLEIDSIKSITTIKVENKVLLKEFEDQQNIIKLNINNKKKTFLLKNDEFSDTINY